MADVPSTWKHFELCEAECKKLLDRYAALSAAPSAVPSKDKSEGDGNSVVREKARFPLLGAYDLCLKCSHYFNILDARGAISVTERVGVIARVRALAVGIAKAWMDQQYPSEKKTESDDSAAKPSAKEKKGKLAPVLT
jgi:glycyl-tRNA synthetase alpha chain